MPAMEPGVGARTLRTVLAVVAVAVAGLAVSGCASNGSATSFRVSSRGIAELEDSAMQYAKGEGLSAWYETAPSTVETAGGVAFAIYRHQTRIAICVSGPFSGSCFANSPDDVRPPISLSGDSFKVIATGIGRSDEVWALVRLSPGTSRVKTTIIGTEVRQLILPDRYAVVTFTNVPVGSKRMWPEHFSGFDLGVVTGFDTRTGFATGSDEIRVCDVGPIGPCGSYAAGGSVARSGLGEREPASRRAPLGLLLIPRRPSPG